MTRQDDQQPMEYVAPQLERFGSLRELTQSFGRGRGRGRGRWRGFFPFFPGFGEPPEPPPTEPCCATS